MIKWSPSHKLTSGIDGFKILKAYHNRLNYSLQLLHLSVGYHLKPTPHIQGLGVIAVQQSGQMELLNF